MTTPRANNNVSGSAQMNNSSGKSLNSNIACFLTLPPKLTLCFVYVFVWSCFFIVMNSPQHAPLQMNNYSAYNQGLFLFAFVIISIFHV